MIGPTTESRDKLLCFATATLFAGFVVLLPRYTDLAKHFFYLLSLLALGHFALHFRQLAEIDRARQALFAIIVLNFVWTAITFYANGQPGRGDSFLWNRHFHLLMLIPIYILFRRIRLTDELVIIALFTCALVSIGDIGVDLVQGVDYRLQGMNPNAFGPILLVLAAIMLFYFLERPERSLRFLALAGCLSAVACVILSKSRVTWFVLVILCLLLTFILSRSLPLAKRIAIAVMILLLLASSYLLPVVKSRVDNAVTIVTLYFASDDYRDESRLRSFGIRAELWKTAWLTFVENPILGVGVGGFQESARANSERFHVNPIVHEFKYAHNQYLAALATRGIPGFLLFVSILVLPICIARSRASETPETRVAQASIVALCLTYLIGSLSEDHFEGKSAIMFVGVTLALMLAKLEPAEPRVDTKSP